jgi:Domain of unknown function (DUF397)
MKVSDMRTRNEPQTSSEYWQKSSLCQNGECVEISAHNGTVLMRNSAQSGAGYVSITPNEFVVFLEAAKAGRFDMIGSV